MRRGYTFILFCNNTFFSQSQKYFFFAITEKNVSMNLRLVFNTPIFFPLAFLLCFFFPLVLDFCICSWDFRIPLPK